jgi:hypothetical protein
MTPVPAVQERNINNVMGSCNKSPKFSLSQREREKKG